MLDPPASVGPCEVLVDPHSPGTIYAGTAGDDPVTGQGPYKSTDGGRSWAVIDSGLGRSTDVWDIEIDPRRPATLYLTASHYPGEMRLLHVRLFKSINRGRTWRETDRSRDYLFGGMLAMSPSRPTTLYATAVNDFGIMKSTDGGRTWLRGLLYKGVTALAIDLRRAGTVYAAGFKGVLRTTNGGRLVEVRRPG